jgi:hypothetical protein
MRLKESRGNPIFRLGVSTGQSSSWATFCRGSFSTRSSVFCSIPGTKARYRMTASEAARIKSNLADAAHLVEPVIIKPVTLSDHPYQVKQVRKLLIRYKLLE